MTRDPNEGVRLDDVAAVNAVKTELATHGRTALNYDTDRGTRMSLVIIREDSLPTRLPRIAQAQVLVCLVNISYRCYPFYKGYTHWDYIAENLHIGEVDAKALSELLQAIT